MYASKAGATTNWRASNTSLLHATSAICSRFTNGPCPYELDPGTGKLVRKKVESPEDEDQNQGLKAPYSPNGAEPQQAGLGAAAAAMASLAPALPEAERHAARVSARRSC